MNMETSTKRARIIPMETSTVLQETCLLQSTHQLPQHGSSLIKSLVRQLASVGVPSSCNYNGLLELLDSIVLILQSHGIQDFHCTRDLHGLLIIYLGFFLSSVDEEFTSTACMIQTTPEQSDDIADADANSTRIVVDLLRCLFYLYNDSSCNKFIMPRACMESYLLIIQLMNGDWVRK